MALNSFLRKVGKKLSEHRRARALTQMEVAEEARIPYRYFQRIEGGYVNITMATLLRIARQLRVHPYQLLPTPKEWNWPSRNLQEAPARAKKS